MIDIEKIQKQAEEIVEQFSTVLESFEIDSEEEYYILDTKNVLREDDISKLDTSFKHDALKIAPKTKDDYIVVEKSKWSN
ncbi:Asp-tRNA(Asn) amidotransferase subunit GatC [Methanococcus aeolicus]|jgi:aspartyl-tRNA(Asn)/glutamyl-tRNA(Gln) amidotransferase subunit C|uniref:Asp-tRNA(Asn)/Glu-tRNA(Gln) amidotransferase, subunit C, putative n=1 Tax=Methanococcus aeolicus (strain ATCC BAA-1280 / DSM 17508 / OCM 812 / Nankai-3) TaxID=419665 RepID=A6UVG6_META3|nr:Asp-tRNA(Asn) amidotransferase subunit GatC [Methanococcus aeolicus]ABR56488.1 Asp-tRNA(Asn)/Glu-tRNA(Gln) amidotransferase, subunit C, putative [Methanococcus aeolicus Nankai-3]UXM84491.1 Asp-tRNA(Asn) amidotransferase subunit GatC [Methanococcus aeolicus]